MLLVVSSIKLVAEIALMALFGQWVLGLLAGRNRDQNLFYQLLKVLTNPFVSAVRRVSPRQVLDRHIPLATAVLLSFIWLAALLAKISLCLSAGMEACR